MTYKLYLKIHNKTGLKYLGKTCQKDHESYPGSGKYWISHLEKHGYDYSTKIIFESKDKNEFQHVARQYSVQFDIVNSKEFANLVPEEGGGGDTSKTEGFLLAMRILAEKKKLNRWWNNGTEQVHAEVPPDNSYRLGRLPFNNVGAKVGSEINRKKKWYTNGQSEFFAEACPDGFVPGRIRRYRPNNNQTGTHWWNNGLESTMSTSCPGTGWIKGRKYKVDKSL